MAVFPQSQNGNYENPPRVKRQHRDPYGGWWDQQERRNFGEPVHEENEILGVFSPEEYTHVTPRKGLFQIGCFVAAVLGLTTVTKMLYPDKPSVPQTYPGGLEKELGGPHALPVSEAPTIPWTGSSIRVLLIPWVRLASPVTNAGEGSPTVLFPYMCKYRPSFRNRRCSWSDLVVQTK